MSPQGYALHVGAPRAAPLGNRTFAPLAAASDDAYRLSEISGAAEFSTRVLAGSSATTGGVIKELESIHREVQAGDTVIVSFSGHGWQVHSSDPNEDDGLDEVWMLTDGYLTDTTVGRYLHGLPPGVTVVVIVDACRSRTASFIVEPVVNDVPLESILERRSAEPLSDPATGETRQAATVLTLAAVDRDDATAFESESGGILTSALVSSWHELRDGADRPTWGGLWSRTVGRVRAYETPERAQRPIATLRGSRDNLIDELAFNFERHGPASDRGPL